MTATTNKINDIHKLHDEAYAMINAFAERSGMRAGTIRLIPTWDTEGHHYMLDGDIRTYKIEAELYKKD